MIYLLLYGTVAFAMSILNVFGLLKMVRDGQLTFSGLRSHADWFRVACPLFINAIGQAAVWPLSLPLALFQLADWIREGPPSAHIQKSDEVEAPSSEQDRPGSSSEDGRGRFARDMVRDALLADGLPDLSRFSARELASALIDAERELRAEQGKGWPPLVRFEQEQP